MLGRHAPPLDSAHSLALTERETRGPGPPWTSARLATAAQASTPERLSRLAEGLAGCVTLYKKLTGLHVIGALSSMAVPKL